MVSTGDAEQVIDRLQLTREEAAVVRAMASLSQSTEMLRRRDARPSGIVAVLDRFPNAAVAAFAALSEDAAIRTITRRYLHEWRDTRPLLNGNDLREMGIPEGPAIGKGLQLIRAARLDGWASDRDDERALVLRFAKSIRDSRAMNQPIDFQSNGN
jgi:tRNA nucleotidyltransferase (CCA-adding enzyme)